MPLYIHAKGEPTTQGQEICYSVRDGSVSELLQPWLSVRITAENRGASKERIGGGLDAHFDRRGDVASHGTHNYCLLISA